MDGGEVRQRLRSEWDDKEGDDVGRPALLGDKVVSLSCHDVGQAEQEGFNARLDFAFAFGRATD